MRCEVNFTRPEHRLICSLLIGDMISAYVSENLAPLKTLLRKARAEPRLRGNDSWRLQMVAAIAAARAGGVSSDLLTPYERMTGQVPLDAL